MKTIYSIFVLLLISGCGNDGSNNKSAQIPTNVQTNSAAQSPEKICQWLFEEGLIANRYDPAVNFYFLKANGGNAGADQRGRGRDGDNQNSNVIVFNGSCANSQNQMMVYVKGTNYVSGYRDSKSEDYSYSLKFEENQLTETYSLRSKGQSAGQGGMQNNRSFFKRILDLNLVGLTVTPGSLQIDMTGPGTYSTNGYAPLNLNFKSTILLNSRLRSWQVVGQVPSEVYGLILNIRGSR